MNSPADLECPESSPFTELASNLLARDVMVCGITSVECDAPLVEAASLMLQKKITGLPVVHQESLIGMLSDKDLLRNFSEVTYLPGKVEDYMTDKIVTFDVEDRFADISRYLSGSSFRRVPILREQKLAGMITRSDLIRAFLKKTKTQLPSHPGLKEDELIAEHAMKCGLLTLRPEASLIEAMDIIANHHITGIPIVSSTLELLGIITEKDLLMAISSPDVMTATVEAYMSHKVITFERKSRLKYICECLLKYDFHQVPIVDENTLVGIISRLDILRMRVKSFKL